MANEGFTVPSQFGDGSNTPKAAILIIIGEPSSDEHRDLILAELTKGFKSWDNEGTGVDINDELAQIANRASLGEEGPNGERLIRHGSDNVAVEVLIDPQTQSVTNAVKSFLVLPVPNKFLIFAGHAFKGSGDWVLQDGIFTFKKLAHILNDAEVETALKDQPNASLTMHCLATGDWNSNISKQEFSKIISLNVNPSEKLDNVHGILQFTTYVSSFIKVRNLMDMLPASDVIGSISFNKPTLYIFPGCQGDAALFGIKGFHLLVNAGFNRKACFWDFTRHLDRIDAVLLTHLGTDNLFGINSVLKRKCLENAHPEIGYIYMNGVENTKTNGTDNGNNNSLLINLADEGSELFEMSKKLGVTPHPCTRGEKVSTLDPINLYHKVGHGSLDMYILNPVTDSKELKDFFQQWTKKVGQFGTHQGFPMPDMFSICALLVWKPTNPEEKITRVLFPGNCPQHKIIEGLEKVKSLEIFKHASCTGKDLLKPASGAKKAGTPISRTSATKATTRPASAPVKKEVRKSPIRTPTKTPTTPRSSPPKTSKPDIKKAPAKSKDTRKEKSDKSKTPSSSPSKASGASSSPAKSVTPVATPVEPSSPASHAPDPAVSSAVDAVGINGLPEGLPSPDQYAALQTSAASVASPAPPQDDFSKQQLADLGIYDEDDDVGASDGGMAQDSFNSQPVGSSVDEIDENIPHNLPEPVAVPENTSLEPDLLNETSVDKGASVVQNDMLGDSVDPYDDSVDPQNVLDESLQSEPDVVPHSEDPAYDIPSSPEPNFEEQDLPAIAPGRTAPLPNFTNEPDVVPSTDSVEQNIQYGVTEDSRQMGALREEDEEEVEQEVEQENQPTPSADDSHDSQNMEDLGIYEDDEGSQDGNDKGDPAAFAQEKNSDFEEESIQEAEKQFGDGVIETDAAGNQSHIPEAFERDTTPPLEESPAPENALNGTNGIHEDKDDADSIDGETPEMEKGMLDTTGKLESLQESALQSGEIPISPVNPDEPFESLQSEGFNPFHGIEGSANPVPSGNGTPGSEFDPVQQWGEPMGLPSPPPPGTKPAEKNAKPKAATKKPEPKKPATGASLDKKPTTARPSSATTKAPSKPNGVAKKPEAKKPTSAVADKKQTAAKARPATAPAKTEVPKPKSAPIRKPAARTSPAPVKLPPLPSLTPFYVDLTYIPNHGESNYCDVEFFKRVRARHYVLSALSPNPETLNALLEAKPSWENKDLEVMVIPTYDNETLRHWLGLNKEKLSQLKIDVAPSASRCFIQLQDHEANCSAYRLEF